MPIQIQAPDGSLIEFPDGTDDSTIKSVMAKNFGSGQPPGVPEFDPHVPGYDPKTGEVTPQYGALGSAAMGAADAGSLGFGDELASYLGSALTGTPRDQVLAQMRGDATAAQEQNPGSYLAGQIGGGLAQAAATGGAGLGTLAARSGAGLGRVAIGSAADGALYGGAYGAGSDDGDLKSRIASALTGGFVGGVAGGALPIAISGISSAAQRAVTPFALSPERQAAIDFLTQEGVPLTAGQKTGSRKLGFAESEIGGGKAADIMDEQGRAFTDAAMRRAGGSGLADPDNLAVLESHLGQGFHDLSSRNTMQADGPFLRDFVGTLQEYNRVLPSEQKQILGNIASDIGEKIKANGGTLPGEDYQLYRSRLTKRAKNARGSDNELADAYRGLRNALDSAMERSINPADAGEWLKLRRQYGNYKVLQNASLGAGEAAGMGIISPARLRMAASSGNRGGYATGQSDFTKLAKAGQAVMTPLPNSGTASRINARNLGSGLLAGGGALTAGLPGMIAGLVAPQVAGRALMSRPVQKYLANQAVQSARDPVKEAIVAALLRGGAIPAIEGR